MNANSTRLTTNRFSNLCYIVHSRRTRLLNAARGYLLFHISRLTRSLPGFGVPNLTLGQNVRLQRNSSVLCAGPDARIAIGANSIVYEDARLEAYGKGIITVERDSIVGACRIVSRYSVSIGERFLCSWNVFIQDFDSHPADKHVRRAQLEKMVANFLPRFEPMPPVDLTALEGWNFPGEPVCIGDDVWVGANTTILKGARIGDGCIVAAGAVVLRGEYSPGTLIAGNPAKVVKTL